VSTGSNVTVREVYYYWGRVLASGSETVASVNSHLRFYHDMLPEGNRHPTSVAQIKAGINAESWQEHQRVYCNNDKCAVGGTVMPRCPREDWSAEKKCKCCKEPLFREVIRPNGDIVLEPKAWFIQLNLQQQLQSLFSMPEWVQYWNQGRRDAKNPAPGDRAGGEQFGQACTQRFDGMT
jgi:hypothetical protein